MARLVPIIVIASVVALMFVMLAALIPYRDEPNIVTASTSTYSCVGLKLYTKESPNSELIRDARRLSGRLICDLRVHSKLDHLDAHSTVIQGDLSRYLHALPTSESRVMVCEALTNSHNLLRFYQDLFLEFSLAARADGALDDDWWKHNRDFFISSADIYSVHRSCRGIRDRVHNSIAKLEGDVTTRRFDRARELLEVVESFERLCPDYPFPKTGQQNLDLDDASPWIERLNIP